MKIVPRSRRRFLLCSSVAVAGAGAWHVWHSYSRKSPDWQTFRRSSLALGSSVSMTVLHTDESQACAALDAAFAELELIESVMSLYRTDSQLSRLNRDGFLDHPHPHLVKVLQHAAQVAAQTNGAFDITVQPLWEIYRDCQKRGALPTEDAIRTARGSVDWRRVELGADFVRLTGVGTKITLNGIAQGFATDAAMATLRRCGVEHALINTGELGAIGAKPTADGWKVGIQHPRKADAFISLARLKNRCLATSGDYQTRFTEGFAHHHLFDPNTGHSPVELSSVSVAAPSAMTADALSTTVFVMGLKQGMALVKRTPRVDALIVLKDGSVIATDDFPNEAGVEAMASRTTGRNDSPGSAEL